MKQVFTIVFLLVTVITSAQIPVAFYPFNGNANDVSGNSLNGTVNGVTLTNDRFDNENSAYSFTGSNNITIPNSANLNFTSAITLSAWIFPTAYNTQYPTIIAKHNAASSFELNIENNNTVDWECFIGGQHMVLSGGTIQLNQWTFVVATYDGSIMKIFKNGVQVASQAATGTIGTNNLPVEIGSRSGGGTNFFGKIDDVKIYNVALTATQIQQEFAISQQIQKSGSGNALSFDGSNDQVNVNSTFTQQDFTIDMWLKPGATQVQHADIIDNNHTGFQNWVCQQNDNNTNNYVFGVHRSNGGLGVFFNLTANVWQHLTLVKSPTVVEAYINGVLIQSTPWSGTINYTSQFLTLANWFNGGRNWNGQMDEFRFWNTPLTQSQIRDRMCKKITSSDSLFNNLVAYYNFDESNGNNAFDGSLNASNGNLTNSPTRIISGAAIGNASSHSYSGASSTTSLTHPTRGDVVTASLTTGAADGVQVYCVTENPNTKSGIDTLTGNNSYFGVFAINGTNPNITTTYNYNGIALSGNTENRLSLYKRNDNAATTWSIQPTSLDSTVNTLTTASQNAELIVGANKSLQELKPGSGNALSFDGVNDRVVLNNTSNNIRPNSFITIESWIKINANVEFGGIVCNMQDNGSDEAGYYLTSRSGINNVGFRLKTETGGFTEVLTTVPLNTMHHIVATYDGSNIKLYVNGILKSTLAKTGNIDWVSTNSTQYNIGAYTDDNETHFFNGTIDEVRVWNTALSQSQIRDRMCRKITSTDSLFSNLIGYYNFDETTGTTAFDGSINANNGTLTNSPTRVTSGAAIGNASSHNYSGASSTTTLTHPTRGDAVTATLTSGAANGIQVYCVTENPNTTSGQSVLTGNNSYFGVFAINGTNPNIAATYNYSGIALNGNAENRLSLYKRNDNATTTWNSQSTVLDSTANTLTTSIQNGEVIIGLNTPLQETIILRSGNGSIGQADSKIKMLVGPADTHFPNLFTNTDFTAARNGSAALITQNNGAWIASLPADANAKWINDVGNSGSGSTCLFAIDFMVNGNVTNADITFNYAIDNVLGGNLNQGVYINGQALSGNTANIGGFGGQNTIVRNDIASMLQQGVNTLYVNATDQGGPGALIFSATINMIYNNNNPGVISASQSSCVPAIPAPLTGTTAFNTSTFNTTTGVTYQWQDSTANGIWANILNATNGDTCVLPLLSSQKYFRRLATFNNTTLASNEILLDFQNAINPSTFPINQWNIYCYNGADINLGTNTSYRGSYSVNGLNQDTRNHWNELLSPSVASGYQGCSVNNDNFTFVLKRKGVTSGEYLLNILTHDDGVRVLVNGIQKFEHLTCCDTHKNISLGNLDDSSAIEIRCTELTAPASAVLSFMKVTRISDTLTGCSNVTLNGKTFSSSTTVTDTTKNAQGFDSIYTTTNIIISGFATTTNTQNFSGCNVVTVGSNVFTSSAIIRDTIRTIEGCDSIINVKSIVVTPISLTTITNNITACNSVVFRGTTFTSNATIIDTLKSVQGCDSVIITNNIRPQIVTNITNNLSGCNSVLFKGTVFSNSTIVRDTLKSVQGCDSVITNTNIVVTTITVTTIDKTVKTCITAGAKASGGGGSSPYIIRDTLRSVQGCDSVITNTTTEVTTVNLTRTSNTISGCNRVVFNNQTFTSSTVLRDTVRSVLGCDSIINEKNIVVTPISVTTITNNVTACNSVVFRGTTFTSNATIRDTIKSIQGCDSVITINNIRPQIATTITNNISGVHSVTFKGTVFTSDAIVKDTVKSTVGCDSIITVTTITVIKVADLIVTDISALQSSITPKNKINISWIVKNIGKANSGDGWQERISIENGNGESVYLGTAYFTNTLDSATTVTRQIEFTVPEIVTLNDSALIKIVVVPNANTTEPVLLQANNTAYANDSIFVNKQLFIKPSTVVIEETDATVYNGYLFRSGSRKNAETFILKSSNANRLQVVDTIITIGTGLSGAAFQYKAKDNLIVDADNNVALFTIANANYSSSSDTLKINDNELAQLAITLSKDSTTEGDTLQVTIVRQVFDNLPLVVNLSSSNDNRVAFDKVVTIPANQTTANISVAVNKTNKPVLAEQINFTAFANRYNTATDNVVIKQNNIPTITLEVLPASFSESAGIRAAIAKVKRLGSTDFAVTLNIADNSNGEIFYPSSSVTINKGESEAQFFIGVNDNGIVDNARNVNLSAAVFFATCGCTVSSSTNTTATGFVSKQITILDDDGPSLNLSLSETNLPEGKNNASIITVTRNTTTTVPLTINLSSTRDSQLVYNKTATIPVGSNKIDVPVSVPSNSIAEGDRIVTFTATASGFANSSSWAIITDRTLPDATITLMPLSFDSVFAQSSITLKSIITNEGVINIPVGTRIDFYTSTNSNANANGQLMQSFSTTKLIAPGQKDTITTIVQLPNILGQQNVFAQVNPTQSLPELSYINNFSKTLPLTFLPAYKFINIATNKAVYIKNDSIIITGKAQALNNVSVANVAVEVYVINNQFREAYSTTTDANGNFRFQLVTLQGQLGHFSVGACYTKLGLTEEQAGFELLGLRLTNNDFIKWEINVNDTLRGSIKLVNPSSSVALTKLKTVINSSAVNGWTLHFDSIPNIAADDTANLNYYITSNRPTPFNNYEQIKFTVTTDEGVSLDITSYFYCRALSATLQSSVATLQTTMAKGTTKLIPIVIKNIGIGATGNITVSIPNTPFMHLQTPVIMPSLNFGDSQIVVIELSPLSSMPANVPVVGSLAINCQQGNSLVIPFSLTPVSTNKGSLKVSVEDEFTYFSAGQPLVKGALVKVNDIYTNVTIAQGITDSTGIIKFDSIPDGFYKLNVTAQQHDSYINNILINAGEQKDIRVFIGFQAISYTWNVEPTTVKDTYNIKAILTFVTNVPVPVVVLTMPDSIPKLLGNDVFTFKAVMTNKGLITAKDVQFILPNDEEYEFIYNYTTTNILAQQSIQVPVLVRRKSTASKASSPSNPKCADLVITIYGWECGSNNKFQAVEKTISFAGRNCSGQAPLTPTVGGGVGVFLNFPSNGLDIKGGIVIPPIPYVRMDSSCNPCIDAIGAAAVGCIPGLPIAAGVASCASSLTDAKITSKEVVTCILNFAGDVAFVAGCTIGAIDAYCVCQPGGFCDGLNKFNSGDVGGNPFVGGTAASKNKTFKPSSLLETNMNNLVDAFVGMRSLEFWLAEIFIGIEKKSSAIDFYNKVQPFISDTIKIQDTTKIRIKNQMFNQDVTPANIDSFVKRWNNTVDAWKLGVFSPNSLHSNIIDSFRLHYYDSLYQTSYSKATSKGFANVKAMQDTALNNIRNITSKSKSSVCAAVTIQFSQTVTMTRQAFRGTFTLFNGNTTDSVKDFKLNIVIKDDQGNIMGSNKFQTNTESISKFGNISGTGILGPKDTGSATLIFIPTKNAAPTVPKQYSFGGSLSYLDPFTGTVITRDLSPVTITVNPSPDLVLDYFVQRDILGDDPLTLPVEASIPAEFSLIINNKGFGDATEVNFTTEEPKIIDNQKGLLLNLNFVGSSLNGAPTSIGFQHLNFGTINARSTMFGQWFFTSSLLGQFVNYDVNVTHVSSYNNPDLSLISEANIHQLVHTINVPSSDSANSIAFLSTDVPNLSNNPDAIYVTNGTKHSSFVAQNASVTIVNDSTLRLTVTPSIKGWNYKSVANPFAANKTLKKVIKENNNANVSLRNVWLTDRTLLDGQDPIYENRIHISDDVQDSIQSYILTFNAEPNKRLAVDAITGVPDTIATIPVHKVTVHFNKAIQAATFTNADVVVRCQGAIVNTNNLLINKINDSIFELDITALTDSNGYYTLTVQTNAITDVEGFNGIVGVVVGWNQFADSLQIIAVANPAIGGSVNPSFTQQSFGSNLQLTAHAAVGYKFTSWTIDNVGVSVDSVLNHLVTSSKSITANFEKKKCILNVVTDDVKGIVTSNSSGVYEFGNIISASVTANSGYLFLGWKLNDILVSTNPSFTFSINKDVKLEPTFKTKVNPILVWNNPLVLTCSKSLQAALNATADVSGSFVYNPPLGTVLNNNSAYALYVTFLPADTFNFNKVTDSVFVSTNFILVATTSTNINSCSSVVFNGITYNSSTLVRDTLRNVQGCDSVIKNTNIAITPITATTINNTLTGCNNVVFKGTTFTNSATVKDTVRSLLGCDSIITNTSIIITSINVVTFSDTISGCNSVVFNGNIFSNSTTIRDTLKSSGGCDSVIKITVIIVSVPVIPSITIAGNKTNICNMDTVLFNSNILNGVVNPAFQWKKSGVSAGNSPTISFLPNTLTTGDVITCVLTSNNACQTNSTAISNAIQLTVKPSPAVAQISNGTSNVTTASLCTLGSVTKYFNTTPYGTWVSSNPTVASVTGGSQVGSVTANVAGTTIIRYNVAATNGCVSSSTLTVTVAPITANPIIGNNNICVSGTTTLSTNLPSSSTKGVWNSSNNLGTITALGVYTGQNAGNYGEARYTITDTITGCTVIASKIITVNPTPAVPTITYAAGTVGNPQAGAPAGSFCVGKKFRVAGTPNVPLGVWSSTGVVSILGVDTVKINSVGAGSIKYTYTSAAGCSSSRIMSGNGFTCASRGVSINTEQSFVNTDFTIYPNPAKSIFNVNVETLVGSGSIVITDLYGKQLKLLALSMGANTIDISNLNRGFYLVSIITTEGKKTKKLVIE